MSEDSNGRWITVRGHHVFVNYASPKLKIGGKKMRISDRPSPLSGHKIVEAPIGSGFLDRAAKGIPEAVELKDALREKFGRSPKEVKSDLARMHVNSIMQYGEASGDYRGFHFEDVTDEAIKNANPGKGRVFTELTDAEEADPNKQEELEDAKNIVRYFGGDIVHLKERNDILKIPGLHTADYMHNGRMVERKGTTAGSGMTGRIRDATQQIATPTAAKYDGKIVIGRQGGILISVKPKEDGVFRSNGSICDRIAASLQVFRKPVNYPLEVMIIRGQLDVMIVKVTKE